MPIRVAEAPSQLPDGRAANAFRLVPAEPDKVLEAYDESQVETAYEPHPSDGRRRRADLGAYLHRRPGVW
jgi:hypothetical protein